jgi:hypothetical protein
MEAMVNKRLSMLIVAVMAAGALVAGCGSGGSAESPQTTSAEEATESAQGGAAPTESTGGATEAGTGGAAVPSEAESLATGDIPDNQEFLTFTDQPAGYSIKYPAGWARTGNGNDVTFREKGNVVHIAVHSGAAKSGEKKTLTRQSAPDPVTGKSVPLLVDVYEYEKGGKVAVLELSTPEGVDNVDAYRMISESFKWR